MDLCYDEAVQAGLSAYRTLEYAESCRSAFRVASREFKVYLEATGLQHSPELAQQWINDSKEHWNNSKLKSSRKAMSVLADIMENGCVTKSLQTKIERMPPYTQLPNWSRTLLDNYLTRITCVYGTLYLNQIRNACSRFFLFLEYADISQPSEITHDIVKSFFIKDSHISSESKDRCNNEIRHCLMYMADQGLIPKTVGLALNKFVIPDLIIVSELPESERNRFSRFFNNIEKEISRSKMEYDAATTQLAEIHKIWKYSFSIRKSFIQATRDFKVFMDANLFAYSNDLALEWLEFQRAKWSRTKYLVFRRVLLSINEILITGTLSTSCFSTHKPKYSLPGWGNNLLSQYLLERKREGCASSTLGMILHSCSRFIVFLDNHGIISEKGITPEVIKHFQAQDNHSTVEGKNAYAIKIRGFLRFLARRGLVPETLELAVSTEMAPHISIVNILSDNQIDAIYAFRQNADRPIEMRNAAIIMLGLRMGLRASDIANLKLTDISWKDSSISFIQQKTGVHLKLPLPVDVGNSLYRYICEGRPQSNSHHIFIHHRAPYCRFSSATFGRLLKAAVTAQCEDEAIHGFHVTRKTFASKLLATGNPATTIAAALGHVGVDTVDEYLATNEDQMRLCAIGLKGIEYSGGFSL
ncbi:integrase family protein [Desulfofarcimen acetoxidans DSM 771]|uniref:Integrase family protein n=1 Tax=Desulfofarcimen acetoxidans (strain ATCC 49208 / DSM 771 / KCTC 5769 / VKM B-1644 / 5575) TaxID=485916 RepID=C8VVJ2_DESAS|nr:tyrosine-type recombinase/integrase [Desulfofarcimen acetoxidans]ACV62307.1 integrase family protein [Desulfofarcimen acetoxidans DSM 771]